MVDLRSRPSTGRDPRRPAAPRRPRSFPWWSALAGIASGLVLLAVSGLCSLAFSSSSAPLIAVGGAFVDVVPPGLKDLVIGLFGTRDKLVLGISMLLVYAVVTGLIGVLGARHARAAAVLLALLGAAAGVFVLTRAQNSAADVVPTLAGTVLAVVSLLALVSRAGAPPSADGHRGRDAPSPVAATSPAAATSPSAAPPRRALIAGTGVLAAIVAAGAQGIATSRDLSRKVAQFVLPTPAKRAAPIPAGAQVDVAGMPPFVTPNGDFYRIDTALAVPRVDPTSWSLRIHGLVDREIELDFSQLLAEPMVESHVTLTCVSNVVGGDLAGNATWIGVPVVRLLERAGVQDGADMVLSRSTDGFTASTPLEALTDGRDSLLAVGMNGSPLPPEHGYPVRMVVPGLYGYVSATKWLTELTVTRFADQTAYWTSRGWSERGPIKTASRIDVPREGKDLEADGDGAVMLGGTAWAQHRGVRAVQVQIDDGDWLDAELGTAVTSDTWTQWALRWGDARPGKHTARVRATDDTGELQTSQHADPAPNGSSGWHTIRFTVA
ncbi:molybdopterin-dependent oxidoreductase [Brachybacterium halotolerans subsp. kimchii]|uniref:molybdopterin-dependent oxidoreductase n=1 Tax=Brachybacterium halotolerans TaxID=2795215 RepID=UPI001E4A5B6C|nr:molybdopterin-dependent oxidoreductase [Brachybacterium halotolerans]UEJ81387.1 molybdopterin-dependent oxidoreductase [Brachybacterium halotolerans subsp. kimchii]